MYFASASARQGRQKSKPVCLVVPAVRDTIRLIDYDCCGKISEVTNVTTDSHVYIYIYICIYTNQYSRGGVGNGIEETRPG